MGSFKKWLMRLSLIFACTAAIAALVAGPGYRFGLWTYGTGLLFVPAAIAGGGFAAILGLLGLVLPAKGVQLSKLPAIIGLVLGGATALFLFSVISANSGAPMIHDISTDTENPPVFDVVVALRDEGTNTLDYVGKTAPAAFGSKERVLVVDLQQQHYPDIQPLVIPLTPADVFDIALTVAEGQGWKIVSAEPERMVVEATDTTFWFGFKDDVVIRLTGIEGEGTRVDVRSVSRVGISDLGANADRIRAYLADLEQAA